MQKTVDIPTVKGKLSKIMLEHNWKAWKSPYYLVNLIPFMNIETNKVHYEIENFKETIYQNYGIKIHVFFKEADIPSVSLEDLEFILVFKLKKDHPDFKQISSFRDSTSRKYYLVLYRQLFCYIAHKKYGYSKSEIGRYLSKDHTTVIHSIRSVNNYFDTDDKLVKALYNDISKAIKDYVGSITKNSGE